MDSACDELASTTSVNSIIVPGRKCAISLGSTTVNGIVMASMRPGIALQETSMVLWIGSTLSTSPVAGYFCSANAQETTTAVTIGISQALFIISFLMPGRLDASFPNGRIFDQVWCNSPQVP